MISVWALCASACGINLPHACQHGKRFTPVRLVIYAAGKLCVYSAQGSQAMPAASELTNEPKRSALSPDGRDSIGEQSVEYFLNPEVFISDTIASSWWLWPAAHREVCL